MDFPCTIKPLLDGTWQARCQGSDVGNVEVVAKTRHEALDIMRQELRYRVEYCPCSAVADDYVQLQIRELVGGSGRGSVF